MDSPRVSEPDLDHAPLMHALDAGANSPHATPNQRAAAWTPVIGRPRCSWVMLLALLVSAALITIGLLHWRSRPPPADAPLRMHAWVLGSKPERLASSTAAIQQAFPTLDLSISSAPMVPLTDPRVQFRRRADAWAAMPRSDRKRAAHAWDQRLPPIHPTAELRALSTSLGWMDMWTRAGADSTLAEEEWMLMFEDDVALVPQPEQAGPTPFDYTPALLELLAQPAVQSDGIVYLGACGPQWASLNPPMHEWNRFTSTSAPGWLSSRRAVAWCTHALVITKRRARTLVSDLATFLHTSLTYASDTNLRSLFLATKRWPFVLGAERRSPIIKDHWGIFFQDRAKHKSIINQPADPSGKTATATNHATERQRESGAAQRPQHLVAPIVHRQSGAQIPAWILTSKPERYRSSVAAIERAFPKLLNITAVAPVPLSDPRIEFRRRCDAWEALSATDRKSFGDVWRFHPPPLSNVTLTKRLFGLSAYFGWMDMWARAGNDPSLSDDNWVLMFEDDVAVVPQAAEAGPQPFDYTSAFLELLAHPAAVADGIVSLGACAPRWAPNHIPEPRIIPSSNSSSWLSSRRALGLCMHAMAFTKRRARSLHSDISAYLERDRAFIMDVDLRRFGLAADRWPFLFGDQRRSPQFADHRGLFYQDRKKHQSIIDGAKGGELERQRTTPTGHASASTGAAPAQPIIPRASSAITSAQVRAPSAPTPLLFPPAPPNSRKKQETGCC